MKNLSAELILASDIHLGRVDDVRGRLLLDVIARIDPTSTEAFVLNGDVFDFCFGESAFYREKFRALGDALSGLAAKGVRVIFVEGNHEFHMTRVGWQGVEIIAVRDFILTLKSGARIVIMHGDLLADDPWYRRFRALVKSRFAATLAKLIPGALFDALTMKYARHSRSQDEYRTLDHGRILAAFERWLTAGGFRDGIIGHFHVPYAERRSGGGQMMSVDCWDKPNLLLYRDGKFERVLLEREGAPFLAAPAASVLKQGNLSAP